MTKRQQDIYDFIISYIQKNLYPPTVREIGDAVGLKSTSTTFAHLKAIEKRGYIEMPEYGSPRAIKIKGFAFVKEVSYDLE